MEIGITLLKKLRLFPQVIYIQLNDPKSTIDIYSTKCMYTKRHTEEFS